MKTKIKFLIARLRNTSAAELNYRVREKLFKSRNQLAVKLGYSPISPPPLDADNFLRLKLPRFEAVIPLNEIEQLLGGEVFRLNFDIEEIEEFENKYQRTYFSKIRANIKDPDIRAVWEPARLQHLTQLFALNWSNLNAEVTSRLEVYTKNLIFDWIDKNPFLLGPHYMSVMECALRIPLFVTSLKYLALESNERDVVTSSIYSHTWLIENCLSLYSSLGNHTVCEGVGLIYGGAVFQNTVQGKRWMRRGVQLLEQELDHQILPDGGPAEQSLNYHRFVLDLYWLAVDFLEINGFLDCKDWKPRLLRGESFLSAFCDYNGSLPSIGDSDDGYAIAPGIVTARAAVTNDKKSLYSFNDSGYTVIKMQHGSIITFDHGPLGLAPLYNHGHADALSITLTQKEDQLLVDPGTYRYNGVPEWRRYFKGTRAHNTVTIDGLDQAIQETSFIWSKPYNTKLLCTRKTKSGIVIEAVHDGYSRLTNPVAHSRKLCFIKDRYIIIKDFFTGDGIHHYELNFHLHPETKVNEIDGWWHIEKGSSKIALGLYGDQRFNFFCGQDSPPLGWFSPAYGIKQKSGVLQASAKGSPEDVSFCTVISLSGESNMKILENFAKEL